jgi:hypothetical protein
MHHSTSHLLPPPGTFPKRVTKTAAYQISPTYLVISLLGMFPKNVANTAQYLFTLVISNLSYTHAIFVPVANLLSILPPLPLIPLKETRILTQQSQQARPEPLPP